MSYKVKEMSIRNRTTDGIIDMQIKHCSGKRAIDKNNPNRFTDYVNISVSASEELGPDFEEFMIEMAIHWRRVKYGNVLVYESRLCEYEGGGLREIINQNKLKPTELKIHEPQEDNRN